MYKYARYIDENTVEHPSPEDFVGVPNWQENESYCRAKGLLPLVGTPEDRPGYEAVPSAFQLIQQTKQVQKSFQVIVPEYDEDENEIGSHQDWEQRTVEVDDSIILVTEWDYKPLPTPEQEPPRTVFTRYEALTAMHAIPALYAQLVAAYQSDIEVQLWWNSVNELDLNNPDLLAICQRIGIGNAEVEAIVGAIA